MSTEGRKPGIPSFLLSPPSWKAVGNTPLIKVKELCGACNGATVYVKDESKNRFGTFKDRRSAALFEHYKDKSEIVFVHITSGNSGYSLGMMAEEERRRTKKDIRVVNIIDKGTPKTIRERLESCSKVVEMDLSSGQMGLDEQRELGRSAASYEGHQSNIVGVEEYHIANGYSNILREIYAEGIRPKYVFCPVGNGELLVELADVAKELWGYDAPLIVGVTIQQNILHRAADFVSKIGRSIADKLVAPYSMYKELVEARVKDGSAELMKKHPKEDEIAKEYERLNRIGINVEPSAAVAFWGAKHYELTQDDTVVIINTGKGVYDPSSLNKVWKYMLKPRLKKLGLVAAGALLSLGIVFGNNQYEKYKSHEHFNLATQVSLISETGGFFRTDVKKLQTLCMNIPDMTKERCGEIRSASDLTDRELQFLIYWDGLKDDNANMGLRLMAREWYLKYNGQGPDRRKAWMPLDDNEPEEYEMYPDGSIKQASRKTTFDFMSGRERHEYTFGPTPPPSMTGYPWGSDTGPGNPASAPNK